MQKHPCIYYTYSWAKGTYKDRYWCVQNHWRNNKSWHFIVQSLINIIFKHLKFDHQKALKMMWLLFWEILSERNLCPSAIIIIIIIITIIIIKIIIIMATTLI